MQQCVVGCWVPRIIITLLMCSSHGSLRCTQPLHVGVGVGFAGGGGAEARGAVAGCEVGGGRGSASSGLHATTCNDKAITIK